MKLSIRFAYFTILALAIISFKPGWSKATDIDSDAAGLKGEVTEPKSAEGGDVDNVAIYVAKLGTLDHISSTGVVLKS